MTLEFNYFAIAIVNVLCCLVIFENCSKKFYIHYLFIFYVKTEASRVWIVPLQLLTCWTQEILINGPRMNNKY